MTAIDDLTDTPAKPNEAEQLRTRVERAASALTGNDAVNKLGSKLIDVAEKELKTFGLESDGTLSMTLARLLGASGHALKAGTGKNPGFPSKEMDEVQLQMLMEKFTQAIDDVGNVTDSKIHPGTVFQALGGIGEIVASSIVVDAAIIRDSKFLAK